MIIHIRGTSGSGKSTLARAVMDDPAWTGRVNIMKEGRKQPFGYLLTRSSGPGLYVVGHYNTPCGGSDTIPDMDAIFDSVKEAHARGHDVLFEGLLTARDFKRTMDLHEKSPPVFVLALDVPLDVCVASVETRRRARGNDKPLNPKNTAAKHRDTQSAVRKLSEAGVDTLWANRDRALLELRRRLML